MGRDGTDRYRERLLVEKLAAWFGFERLAKKIPGRDPNPLYLFYGFWIVFDVGVLNIYKELTGGTHSLLIDPFSAGIWVGLILATFGVGYMADEYSEAVARIRVHDWIEESNLGQFKRTVPVSVKLGVCGVALTLHFWSGFSTSDSQLSSQSKG